MSKSSKDQIEQDEKKILSELVKNSKENIDTIAKHCGFSRQKAWRLIKQLEEKKLIWEYTAICDDQKIG
jgi:DNA-binding Lrp family transcriptional regulator